ncbi:unnamed protein product [Gongylonema pulchrum]|uniref:Cupin_2 domain-containing protein n=1 Tax=Gongylonema pulchrum TaxID=637853 RepID=A0A183DL95_9BILA|nr:unnamed protein product [Gongylonema pulchrum]
MKTDDYRVVFLKLEQLYEPKRKNEDSVFLIMDGSAYYDVEVEEDDWIRICVERGDLIVIPRGRNHRFTLTPKVSAFWLFYSTASPRTFINQCLL